MRMRKMVTYSTNFMGPISTQWYANRGLTRKVKKTITSQLVSDKFNLNIGDEYETDEVTHNYAGGRIDIRDDSKEGYDGWSEYAVKIMHGTSWNLLSDFLDDLETETQLDYDELISLFENETGHTILWAPEKGLYK